MINKLIIDLLSELINYIKEDNNYPISNKDKTINNFRIKNLNNIVNIIKNYPNKIKSSEQLKDIKGIGKNTLKRIDEILNTKYLNELNDYKLKYYNLEKKEKIINELMEIIGIGHKLALELIDKYKIKSVNDLIKGVNNGEIKVNDKILLGIKYYGKFKGKIPRNEITLIYNYLLDLTNKYNKENNKELIIIICGSYRRGENYSSDIDILLCDLNLLFFDELKNNIILKEYINILKYNNFIIDDITDKNIITKYMGFCKYKNKPIRRLDIRLIPYESIYPAIIYFTGSNLLNQNMRKIAKKLGYKLSEYGLFELKTNEFIYIQSELDLFNKLNMKYLEPQKRSI